MSSWQDNIGPGSHLRHLLDSLPVGAFIDLSSFESFRSRHINLLLFTRATVNASDISFHQIGSLPFGDLQLMTCTTIPVGYLLTTPSCEKRVGRNFAALTRRHGNIEPARVFADGKLTILGNESSMVAVFPSRRWT